MTEPYFKVPINWAEHYPELNCSGVMLHALMFNDFVFYVRERRHYSPSLSHLASKLGLSTKQVSRLIIMLKGLGLVEDVERGQKTNSYQVFTMNMNRIPPDILSET